MIENFLKNNFFDEICFDHQVSYKELEQAFIWNISEEIISYIYHMDNDITNPIIQGLITKINIYRQNILDPSSEFFKQSPVSVFYMLSIQNLPSVTRLGLLSHNQAHNLLQDSIHDISNQEVNHRRNKEEESYGKNIHDYVPFYWNPRNSMLWDIQLRFGEDIIILGFELKKFFQFLFQRKQRGFLFANKNVACGDVKILPYLEEEYYEDLCKRHAKQDLLYPVNIIKFDEFLDFKQIFKKVWRGDDWIKKIMMSEILVYENVPFELVTDIYVQTTEIKEEIQFIFEQENIANMPRIFCGKDGYFFNI